ncbi:MAG: PilN domain-containing protein [Gammaproteobacteria bacterium]|nr:PilN domain-containing protein [Gammaproteobacteria bacterium]
MARINLLPWRDELRKQKQQQFIVVTAGTAVVGGLLVLLAHMQFSGLIDKQNQRNQFLETEIATLEKKILKIKDLEKTKTALLARMDIIQQLQHSRPQSVHLMDQLVLTLPDGLYLKKISQKGNTLKLSGSAQSNARVSAYMRNIDSSEWMAQPKLEVIKTKDGDSRRSAEFILRASQATPAKESKAGEEKS